MTAVEDGTDTVDEDDDGSLAVRRDYVQPMGASVTSEYALTHAASSYGVLDLLPTSTSAATATFLGDVPWTCGETHVLFEVSGLTATGTCTFTAAWTSGAQTRTITTAGLHDIALSVPEGDIISSLDFVCGAGSGVMAIDWLTVQNGPYEFAPAEDLAVDFDTTALPGGGRTTYVRTSFDGTYVFTGSDVGGFAWSDDALDWWTDNGAAGSFDMPAQLGVWDAWSFDGAEVFALTGANNLNPDDGGLYSTTNLGANWTEVDARLGANKHFDDCASLSGGWFKSISSGKLLIADSSSGPLYIASQSASGRGLWVMDTTGDVCQPYDDTTLPVGLATSTGAYDALPSAVEELGTSHIVVGYRVLAGDLVDPADRAALYVCPRVAPTFSCAAPGTPLQCERIDDLDGVNDEHLDVRDIVADTEVSGRFYVADGGRRYLGAGQQCTWQESTVLVLDETAGGWELWDSDDTDPEPDWNLDASSVEQPYYTSDACEGSAGTSMGDLVSPAGTGAAEGREIGGLVADPNGRWLFAHYSGTSWGRSYGCVRMFRADMTDLPLPGSAGGSELGWEPLQDYGYGKPVVQGNAAERRAAVDAGTSWLSGQPWKEIWASSYYHDAAFVFQRGVWDMLVAGQNLWLVPPDTSTTTGWGSARAEDLDLIGWELAWGGVETFQDTTTNMVATCPLCDAGTDRVLVAVGDLGGATVYGDGSPIRDPGERDCHFKSFVAGGMAVDLWADPEGVLPAQAWMVLYAQGGATDPAGVRTLLFSEDGGQSWYWDAYQVGGRTAFLRTNASGEWVATCEDEDLSNVWHAAGAGVGEGLHLQRDFVGHISEVVAVTDRIALIVSASAADSNGVSTGDFGLWVAEYDPTAGMEYRRVENYDVDIASACDEEAFFGTHHIDRSITIHPDSDPIGTGDMRVFVSSRGSGTVECGIREVHFTLGLEHLAEWWEIPYYDPAAGMCELDPGATRGMSLSRDGERLLAFGGNFDGTAGGVCEIDLTSAATPPYAATQAIAPGDLALYLRAVYPHPHVEGLYFAGGVTAADCTACDIPALYALERRLVPTTGAYAWSVARVSGDDLEVPQINDIDWGAAGGDDRTMTDLFVATAGGGVVDGLVSW